MRTLVKKTFSLSGRSLCALHFSTMSGKGVLPPGPTRYPIVGNIPQLKGDGMLYEKLNTIRKDHGDVIYLTLGSARMLVLFGHEKVKECLTVKTENFKYRPVWLVEIKSLNLFDGVVWSNGMQNEKMRAFALPALRPGLGSQTLEQRVQTEAIMTAKEMSSTSGGDSTTLKYTLYKAICNINCGVVFGSRFEYSDPSFMELISIMDRLLQRGGVSNPRNFFPVLQWLPETKQVKDTRATIEKMKNFIHDRVEQARETFDAASLRGLIDMFIDREKKGDNEVVTEDNLCHITRDLFVAGSENVAIGLLWLIAYMIRYPEIQDKCRDCINKALEDGKQVSMEDRGKLVFVEATVNEVLRLANIAPLSVPHATTEEVTYGEYRIPAETMVLTHLVSVHLDPAHWDQPTVFNPDRFVGEDGALLQKEAFYPFSIGPRYCLAAHLARMELLVTFSTLLQRFKFETDGEAPSLKHTQPGAFVEPETFRVKWSALETAKT